VPHEDKKADADLDLGTTEIHIDEQGNIKTSQELAHAASPPKPEPLSEMPAMPEEPAPSAPPPLPVTASVPLTADIPPPPLPSTPVTPLSSVPETPAPAAAPPAPAQPSSDLPPLPPIETPPHIQLDHPAAGPDASAQPAGGHAFIGNTAQPADINPMAAAGQPDWAAPYNLSPMDPLNNASSSTSSEFGSTPVTHSPEEASGNFSQGHAMQEPSDLTAAPVDDARSAVASAIAAAPFDPAFSAPVQALNAQPIAEQPLHPENAPSAPPMPQMPNSDTPMLVLPSDNASSVTASQPIATQSDTAPNTAPPPVPPPLVTNGAVIPTPPQQ
jgi:hypothetical protein